MNIETSSNAATAIFQKSELTGSSRMQRTNSSSKSFEDELKTAADEKTSTAEENDTELKEDDTDKVTSKTDDKKTENKDNKIENTRAEEDSQNENSGNSQNNQNEQNQQTLKGEISTSDLMNIQSGNYASLSDEVKAYLQANGGMFGFNVMQATSRAEITGFAASVDYTNIQMSDSDALFFSNLSSTSAKIVSKTGRELLEIDFGQVPFVGLWAKPGAPFVCIEPWYGICDNPAVSGKIEEKPYIQRLSPSDEFQFAYSITIL